MGGVIDKVGHSLCPAQKLALLPAVNVFSDENCDDHSYAICRKQQKRWRRTGSTRCRPGKKGLSMEADLKLEIAEQGPKAAAVLEEERGRVVMTISGPR